MEDCECAAPFQDMDESEYKSLLQFWVLHMRSARPNGGVGSRYVSVFNGGGGPDGFLVSVCRVTEEFLEEQERFATSHRTDWHKEAVFLGQPMWLLAKMLNTTPKLLSGVSQHIIDCVNRVSCTRDPAAMRYRVSYMVHCMSNMVVVHSYKEMFAIACNGSSSWHAKEVKDMTLGDYATWLEANVTEGAVVHFTRGGHKCERSNSALNSDGTIVHVTIQGVDLELQLTDLFQRGTRIVRDTYMQNARERSVDSLDVVCVVVENKLPRVEETVESLRHELKKTQAELTTVTAERDRLRSILNQLRKI
jgi:hypothetical protein